MAHLNDGVVRILCPEITSPATIYKQYCVANKQFVSSCECYRAATYVVHGYEQHRWNWSSTEINVQKDLWN